MHRLAEILIISLIFLTILSFSLLSNIADGFLHVYFFDVGQGDSIFIKTPDGKQILVDGGPNNDVVQKLGEAMPFYDRDLDVLVISHTDADHITGLVEVLDRYDVDLIIRSNIDCESSLCAALEKKIQDREALVWLVEAGDQVNLGYDIYLNVLYPFNDEVGTGKVNNNSVVAKLISRNSSLLLTGDIEKAVESRLAFSGFDISSNLLKLPHHGSKTSSTDQFLDLVRPSLAFITVGYNRYGHPSGEVIERLEKRGIKYYRTDVDGDVHLIMGPNVLID